MSLKRSRHPHRVRSDRSTHFPLRLGRASLEHFYRLHSLHSELTDRCPFLSFGVSLLWS